MIDLSQTILDAASHPRDWTHVDVSEVLAAVASLLPHGRVDWEQGDEEWGRVLTNGQVVAILCARCPLGFVCSDAGIEHSALPEGVAWLEIASMAEPDFRVDKRILEQVFQRELSDNVSYEWISIEDLWWATV